MPEEILNSVSLAWVRCRSPFVAGARHGKQASQWQNSEKGDNSPRETGTKAKKGGKGTRWEQGLTTAWENPVSTPNVYQAPDKGSFIAVHYCA